MDCWALVLVISYTLQLPPFELVKQALNTDWDSHSTLTPIIALGGPFPLKWVCMVDSLLTATKSASISVSYHSEVIQLALVDSGAASSRNSVADPTVVTPYSYYQGLPSKICNMSTGTLSHQMSCINFPCSSSNFPSSPFDYFRTWLIW